MDRPEEEPGEIAAFAARGFLVGVNDVLHQPGWCHDVRSILGEATQRIDASLGQVKEGCPYSITVSVRCGFRAADAVRGASAR